FGRGQARLAVFGAVEMKHDPVGLPPRLSDPAQVVFDVGWIARAGHLEPVAAHEPLVEERDLLRALGRDFRLAEEMLALAGALLLEAKLATHALELLEHFAIDGVGVLKAERVDARPPRQ